MSTTAPAGERQGRARRVTGRRRGSRPGTSHRRSARRPRLGSRQVSATAALVAMIALTAVGSALSPHWVPGTAILLAILLGVFVLRLAGMVVLSGAAVAALVILHQGGWVSLEPGQALLSGLAIVAGLVFVRGRARLGLQGAASDLMLVDLRDRLVAHGRIPDLPAEWQVDSIVRSAYAEAFSGDFVVAPRSRHGTLLEIVLVDVSGKGQEAGVRSLLLSGAFGGLLGAMPVEGFLPAANSYLLGQDWPEGFATAVHLAVELDTGVFRVSTAGHPPALHLHAGSGRIEIIDTHGGPALGVVNAPLFSVHTGLLAPGDTVMLYTDGLVESPGADVDLGIDRLMGEAERVIATRSGGVDAVLAGVGAGESDDRALILVRRV